MTSITYCENIALVTLRNVPCENSCIADLFSAISDNGINVDMISQTAPQGNTISLAFTISMEAMGLLMPLVNGFKATYPQLAMELSPGMTKINFFDQDMVTTPGVAAKVFAAFAEANLVMTMITTSTVDISVLISEALEDAALEQCKKVYGITPEESPFE